MYTEKMEIIYNTYNIEKQKNRIYFRFLVLKATHIFDSTD